MSVSDTCVVPGPSATAVLHANAIGSRRCLRPPCNGLAQGACEHGTGSCQVPARTITCAHETAGARGCGGRAGVALTRTRQQRCQLGAADGTVLLWDLGAWEASKTQGTTFTAQAAEGQSNPPD